MRSVAAGYETAIAANEVKVAEIYDIALANGVTDYQTSHSEDILWGAGGNTYLAKGISRGPIRQSINGEVTTIKIKIVDLAGTIFANIEKHILDGALITIKRILWNTNYAAGWEIPVFIGRPNVSWNRRGIELSGKSLFGSLNRMVPRDIYQPACNRILYDDYCGLTQSDYEYSGTATGGSETTLVDTTRGAVYKVDFDGGDSSNPIERGDTITGQIAAGTGVVVQIVYLTAATGTIWYVEQSGVQFVDGEELQNPGADAVDVNGTPAEDTTFYELGEIEMTGGDNDGQIRPILASSSNTDTVFWPFFSAIANGDTYKIYPGCDKRAQTCGQKFNNDRQYRGFPFTSKAQDGLLGPTRVYG